MNALVSISYEDRLKAEIRARRARLGFGVVKSAARPETHSTTSHDDAKPYRVPLLAKKVSVADGNDQVGATVEPIPAAPADNCTEPPIEHCRAYAAWRAWTGQEMLPLEYYRAVCWLAGTSHEEIKRHASRTSKESLAKRVSVARSIAIRFPRLTATKVGDMMSKDHSIILGYWGGFSRQAMPGLPRLRGSTGPSRKLSEQQIEEAIQRAKTERVADIANSYGVRPGAIYNHMQKAREASRKATKP